jgi:hypothetical protein
MTATQTPPKEATQAPKPARLTAKDKRLAELHGQGVKTLKELLAVEQKLTPIYRQFAEVIVGIRKEFDDWTGRSQAYRDAVAAMYAEADVPADSQANHQAAIRYHVGNLLREKLPKRKLQELGLDTASPAARKAETKRTAKEAASSEDPMEWARDSVASLLSVQEDLPEGYVVLDLTAAEVDVMALLRAARDSVTRAHQAGAINAVPHSVAIRLLAETIHEAGVMLAELEGSTPEVAGKGAVIDVDSTVKPAA